MILAIPHNSIRHCGELQEDKINKKVNLDRGDELKSKPTLRLAAGK